MQHKADQAGLNWTVDSAGTAGYHIGEPPHKLSQKVAQLNGIDISRQRGRQFSGNDLLIFDRVFVMDQDNFRDVKRIAGDSWKADKVDLMLNVLYPGENREVPDPWYGTEKDFHEVFAMLSDACDRFIEQQEP